MKRLNLIKDFFLPRSSFDFPRKYDTKHFLTAVLIPTYSPSMITYHLLKSINKWYPNTIIVVIDDCTPLDDSNSKVINKIKKLSNSVNNIQYLRTEKNALKAGALNFGIQYLQNLKKVPRIVFTMDDDIKISKETLSILKDALYTYRKVGAVCSTARVTNKDVNVLTRLQALEYHSFNITKIADNSWLKGPLVMQGMITGFRMSALRKVKGFTVGHLIEDYDITARLKSYGWRVKIAQKATAWTTVPENVDKLWKQRIRWTYGGLNVVKDFWKDITLVFQDLIGHSMFLVLISLITLSMFIQVQGSINPVYTILLTFLALANLLISMGYNLIILSTYKDADFEDWFLKLSIIPEFVYSNILSLVLIGSYLFFIYQKLLGSLVTRFNKLSDIYERGLNIFQKIGYSSSWGTKEITKKGGIKI